MTTATPASAPVLPFPIFQISAKVTRYMLYDIDTISWLRKTHNILGVFIGALPQAPQQNVFLGLPLELQPEEARLLVDTGLAYVVDDSDWYFKDIAAKDALELEKIRADSHNEGMRIAKGFYKSKQGLSQKALQKKRDKESPHEAFIPDSQALEPKRESSEETLFDTPTSRESNRKQSVASSLPADSDIIPWSITPTTSYPPLTQPSKPSPPILPAVNPSSYALFTHLHKSGYFMFPGLRFGCQFSVYPGDPLRFHSHFLAMSYDWEEEIDLLDLVGGGRLATGVKKGWLIGGSVGGSSSEDDEGPLHDGKVRTFCLEWGGM